jgi:hypothetical protein
MLASFANLPRHAASTSARSSTDVSKRSVVAEAMGIVTMIRPFRSASHLALTAVMPLISPAAFSLIAWPSGEASVRAAGTGAHAHVVDDIVELEAI